MLVVVALLIVGCSWCHWRIATKAALVLVLFEGAIRRWGVPGAQELVYLLKDLFLLGAYLGFGCSSEPQVRSRLRQVWPYFALLVAVLGLSALQGDSGSPWLAAYGLTPYLFYLPLAVVVPHLFCDDEALKKCVLHLATLATPICLIALSQWLWPAPSFLSFPDKDRSRVMATFSYITGHGTFIIVFFALHVGLLCTKLPKWGRIWMRTNLPLLCADALICGSRSVVLCLAFFLAVFVPVALSTKGWRMRRMGKALLAAAVLVAAGAVAIDRAKATRGSQESRSPSASQRWSLASQVPWPETTLFGQGVGLTHPRMVVMRSLLRLPKPEGKLLIYGDELRQVYVELGGVGFLCWYGLRLLLVYGTWRAFRAASSKVRKPLLLISLLVQLPHLLLPLVFNETAGVLVFALVGIGCIRDAAGADASVHPLQTSG